ncbi:glycoside hydrolase family 73 protein [Paenibacillus solisilvae]|uniref:Glycoside hydrolase family 73 protein n=1 Tax=Paenibacillus solisilvae TaxID=2486751 RepID=A0ABW0W2X7_9BACL
MKLNKTQFFTLLAPIAIRVRLEGSFMFPSLRLAQNLLETGGKLPSWNNLGGYKVGSGKPNAYWRGDVVNKGTWEVYDHQRVEIIAAFRAYDSIYDFYKDQDLLFMIRRYDSVRSAQTPRQQAQALQASGYATDPNYASKLISIMETNGLQQYDIQAEEEQPMTEGEKLAFEALQETVKQLTSGLNAQNATISEQETKISALENHVAVLEGSYAMDVPVWAKDAVDAAVKAKLIDKPNGGGLDFYRLLTVLHRQKLI